MFDNAGRTSQLRAAQRAGARVVFISSRRASAAARRFGCAGCASSTSIGSPTRSSSPASSSVLERLKLRLLRRPAVRYLDVILSRAAPGRHAAILAPAGCDSRRYVLVVPGGGTGHPGADDAVEQFSGRRRALLAARGIDDRVRGSVPARRESAAAAAALPVPGRCRRCDLAVLMRQAHG